MAPTLKEAISGHATENSKGVERQRHVGLRVCRRSLGRGVLRRRAGWHHWEVLGSASAQFITL